MIPITPEALERISSAVMPRGAYRIALAGTNVVETVDVETVVFDIAGHPVVVVGEMRRTPGVEARIPWSSIVLALRVTVEPEPAEGAGREGNGT